MTSSSQRKSPHCLLGNLPPLPTVIKYYDDFTNSYDKISNLESGPWKVHFDGSTRTFNFDVECPANFVPVLMRQTGMRGAFYGTRKEAYAGADCKFVAAD